MKTYLLVKPSEFWKYGSVDINGDYPHTSVEDFNIDSRFNCFMIELSHGKRVEDGKEYLKAANILLTNEFDTKLDVVFGKNDKNERTVEFKSDSLGLYSKNPIVINEVKCIPSKISGMMNYLQENNDLMVNYISSVDNAIIASRFYKELYDETIDGPSHSLISSLKKQFKHSK